jgi:hypothetical protein
MCAQLHSDQALKAIWATQEQAFQGIADAKKKADMKAALQKLGGGALLILSITAAVDMLTGASGMITIATQSMMAAEAAVAAPIVLATTDAMAVGMMGAAVAAGGGALVAAGSATKHSARNKAEARSQQVNSLVRQLASAGRGIQVAIDDINDAAKAILEVLQQWTNSMADASAAGQVRQLQATFCSQVQSKLLASESYDTQLRDSERVIDAILSDPVMMSDTSRMSDASNGTRRGFVG